MIKYDSNSIYARELARLQENPDWQVIANNSLVSALLRSEAEALAEIGRYSEYLFKESKWDTAQNPNSILAMAGILDYHPARAISATGYVYWSLDPRIHNVGTTISLQNFKALNDQTLNGFFQGNWYTPATMITIKSNALITDSLGHRYLPQKSGILAASQAWTTLGVIQGIPASQYITIDEIRASATKSKLNPYLYIPITLIDCENAATPTTKNFLKVTVFYRNGQNVQGQEYVIVNSLLLSTADDYAVELYNDLYNPNLFYLKFPNDPKTGKTLDISSNSSIISIKIDYIQSLGAEGNIYEAYRTFTLETDSDGQTVKLYGINLTPFLDGHDAEGIQEIKENAPKNYVKNYTVGTRESYENLIKNARLKVKVSDLEDSSTIELIPKQVRVYGGSDLESDGRLVRKTKVSFIADGLEDISTQYVDTSETIYDHIRQALNLYLDKFKSPQDIIKFEPPNFINFAVGLSLTLNRQVNSDPLELITDIRDYVDSLWGSNSSLLDFGRSFYPSQLEHQIMQEFSNKGLINVDAEVEAISKLNWSLATREIPNKNQTAVINHTIRAPFSFDPIFRGKNNQKGFKDYNSGTAGGMYVLRFDVFYKKPASMSNVSVASYNSSIFIQDVQSNRSTSAFYLKHEAGNTNTIWQDLENNESYLELKDITELPTSYQYPLQQEVLNDSAFMTLISSDSSISVRGDSKTDPGAIDDYLVYFSADYSDDLEKIGNGWIEFSFDSLYQMLLVFREYDITLRTALDSCPLSILKCNTGATDEDAALIFQSFKQLLAEYIDIYVSLKPIDENLEISSGTENERSVLLIDSADMNSVIVNNLENITSVKRPRMISINYKYTQES